MSDWHNWKINVDQCHAKHIGPPPLLQRRIAHLEAHRSTPRAEKAAPTFAGLVALLRRIWRRAPKH